MILSNNIFLSQNFYNLNKKENLRTFETNSIYRFYDCVQYLSFKIALQPTVKADDVKIIQTDTILNRAREVLGISITDLAEIIGVSRPTIYSFLGGNEPVDNIEKIKGSLSFLNYLTQKILDSKLTLPCSSILRRRNGEGYSLKELIASGEITFDRISFFVENEIEQQAKNKETHIMLSDKNRESEKLDVEAISVPFSYS